MQGSNPVTSTDLAAQGKVFIPVLWEPQTGKWLGSHPQITTLSLKFLMACISTLDPRLYPHDTLRREQSCPTW